MTIAPPAGLKAAFAHAKVNADLEDRSRQDALLSTSSDCRGYIGESRIDGAGRCVLLLSPKREEFRGLTLVIALAWCLVDHMIDEIDIGRFAT